MIYILHIHILAASLAGLHEIHVILQERCVQNRLHSLLVAYVSDCQHILKRDRLSSDEVGARLYAYERHLVGSDFVYLSLEVLQIVVSLERIICLRYKSFRVNQFLYGTAQSGDVCLGGREMEIHQRDHARLHICLRKDVLAGPALMCRKHVLTAEDFLDGGLHTVEGLTARICVICLHHCGELEVGHRIHARIRQHIQINILVLEEEGVVSRILDFSETFLDREEIEFLDHSYLVHLQRHLVF